MNASLPVACEDRDSPLLLDCVLEGCAQAVVVTDRDNRIARVNAAFRSDTGYAEAEVIGRDPSMLGSGRHSAEFFGQVWAALGRDGHWEGEIWNRRKSGEVHAQWVRITRIAGEGGAPRCFVAIYGDPGARAPGRGGHERTGNFDPLTGAPSALLLRDRVEQAIHAADREGGEFVLMVLDLDRFRRVNETFGHDAGDRLLIEIAARIRGVLRDEDTVSRLDGDAFAILLPRASHDRAQSLAERIEDAVPRPLPFRESEVSACGSIGIVAYPADGRDADELLANADAAVEQAKADGGQTHRFFNPDVARRVARRGRLHRAMRDALPRGEFRLAYQPQVHLASGRIAAVETLLRWENPAQGLAGPEDFIPVAEECGVMGAVGAWVIASALRQAREWAGERPPGFRVAVSLGATHLAQPGFRDEILEALEAQRWPAEQLELEFTERLAADDPGRCLEAMLQLHQRGVRFGLRDFGTGRASIAFLRDWPVSTLKIDRRFVAGIGADPRDESAVTAVVALARALGLRCVAEGIETGEQRDYLTRAGCEWGQGRLIGPPDEAPALSRWFGASSPGKRGG